MAYFEQFKIQDATLLFSGGIATTGAGSPIDTQYYGSVSIQIGGSGSTILAQIEGSNDLSNWNTLLLQSTSDLALTDSITSTEDTYILKTSHRYIRYNVANYIGSPSIIIIGRSGAGPSAADNLTMAFNPDTPLQVNTGLAKDPTGGLILSDGIVYTLPSTAGNSLTIDATGYQSFVLQTLGGTTWTALQSVDGINFVAVPVTQIFSNGANGSAGPPNNTNAFYSGIILGRYLRFTSVGTSAVGLVSKVMLKQGPSPGASTIGGVNLSAINGITTVTGGAAGTLAVGGNIAVGAAPTSNPLTIGGSDLTGLTRRLLTDNTGKPFVNALSPYFNSLSNNTSTAISSSNSPGANTSLPINTVGAIPATYQQSAALNVQDTSQYEGQNFTELLAQVLLELRILNQQMYDLPRLIASGQGSVDPPELFRQDPSIFNQ